MKWIIFTIFGIVFGSFVINMAWDDISKLRILVVGIFALLNLYLIGLIHLRNKLDVLEVENE